MILLQKRKLILLLAFLAIACVLSAQDPVNIKVQDGEEKPLAGAMVIVYADSSLSKIEQYFSTNENGVVNFGEATLLPGDWLEFRFLGFENTVLPWKEVRRRKIIQLRESSEQLESVVVEEEAPRVIERGDTKIYKVSRIMDSTEYVIEDVIRKLPGVEVDDQGLIKVDGKNIQTVLIENSSILGRQYNLGTQNIRAEDVDQIEVIRNFESNPVMADFSQSEEIALNLSIQEDKKNIWLLDAILGQGYGDEYKYNAQTKVFQFSKALKVLAIGNAKNAGRGYSMSELRASQMTGKGVSLKEAVPRVAPITQNVKRRQSQVPSDYFNNAHSQFSAARADWSFSERHSILANIYYAGERDRQLNRSEEFFALDSSSYRIFNTEERRLQNRQLGGDLEWKYFSRDQQQSLTVFAAGNMDLKEGSLDLSPPNFYRHDNNSDWINFGGEWIHQFHENWLYRLHSKSLSRNRRVINQHRNPNFSLYFPEFTSDSTLHQRFEEDQLEWENKAQLIFDHPLGVSNLSLTHRLQKINRHNRLAEEEIGKDGGSEFFRDRPLEQSHQRNVLRLALPQQLDLLNMDVRFTPVIAWSESNLSVRTESVELFSYQLHASLSKKFENGSRGNLRYQYYMLPPDLEDFLSVPVVYNPFSIQNSMVQLEQNAGHQVSAYYKWEQKKQMNTYSVRMRYLFGANRWRSQLTFFEQINEIRPLFTEGNDRLYINFHFEKFFPDFFTGFTLKPRWGGSFSNIAVNNATLLAIREYNTLDFEIYSKPARALRFQIDGRVERNLNYRSGDRSGASTGNILKVTPGISWKKKNWQMELDGHFLRSSNDRGQTSHFLSANISLKRRLEFRGKKLAIELEIYNLANQRSFDIVTNTELFYFQNAIEVIPFFALLKADYSFSL